MLHLAALVTIVFLVIFVFKNIGASLWAAIQILGALWLICFLWDAFFRASVL